VPCSPCGVGVADGTTLLFGAVGDNMFAINGRVAVNTSGVAFYSLSGAPTDNVDNSLPYTLAGDQTIATTCWLAPFAGTVSNLWVRNDDVPVAQDSRTFSLYIGRPGVFDSGQTALGVSFDASSNRTLSNTTSSVDFEAGDLLSMGIDISFDGEADTFVATYSVQIDVASI